jgi:hypothetical protein
VFITILTHAKPFARGASRSVFSTRSRTSVDSRCDPDDATARCARITLVARRRAARSTSRALGLCDIAIAANANARRAARERRTTREGVESDDKNALASFARAWGGKGRGRGMEDGDL